MTAPALPFPASGDAPAIEAIPDDLRINCQGCWPREVRATRAKQMSNGRYLRYCDQCAEHWRRTGFKPDPPDSRPSLRDWPAVENERKENGRNSEVLSFARPDRGLRGNHDPLLADCLGDQSKDESASAEAAAISPKPSVAAKLSPLPEGRLEAFSNIQWERNAAGGLEAWHVPDGATHRRDKIYLGYAGKRRIKEWRALDHPSAAVWVWLTEKRAERGITLPVSTAGPSCDTT